MRDTDYYPEDEPHETDSADTKEEGHGEYENFLTPKSALGAKVDEAKPGSEWLFRVVAIHGDEIEWTYATEKKEAKRKSAMDESMDDMDEKMSNPDYGGGGGY